MGTTGKRKLSTMILAMLTVFTMGTTMLMPQEASAASKPGQVKGLKVSSRSYNSLNLSWKKVKGAKNYQVYQATKKSGKYKKVKTTKATVYTKTGLKTGQKYYYKVKAIKGSRSGKYSVIKSAAPKLAKPTAVKVSGQESAVKVTWKKVSGAKGYQVYRATAKAGSYSKVKTTGAASFTDKDVKAGKTYYYKVRAYKDAAYSGFSDVISAKAKAGVAKPEKPEQEPVPEDTPKPTPPGALPHTPGTVPEIGYPQLQIGEAKVIITWDVIPDAEGYQLQKWMYTDKNSWPENYQEIARLEGKNNTSVVDKDIKARHTVRYRVRGYKTYIKNGKTQYVYGPWSSKGGNVIKDNHMVQHEVIPEGEMYKEIDLEKVLKDIEEVKRTGKEINKSKTYLLEKDGMETTTSAYYIGAEDDVRVGTGHGDVSDYGAYAPVEGPWYGSNYVLMLSDPEVTAYYTLDGSIPSPTNGTKVTKDDGRVKMRAPVHVKYGSLSEEITVKIHFYRNGKLYSMLYDHDTDLFCVHGKSYGNGISVEDVKNSGYTIAEWVEMEKRLNSNDWYEYLPENDALLELKEQHPGDWWERLPEDVTTLYQ